MIVGMVFVGLQVRRNVAIASLIILPSALICITGSTQYFQSKKLERLRLKLLTFTCAAVVALSVYGGVLIINGKLYAAEKLPTRFGFGISNIMHPIGAAAWLNKHAPDSRVWCTFGSSSTIHFFTYPHKDVPILTNGWAYPPQILLMDASYRVTAIPFNLFADRYDIDAVILDLDQSKNLIRQLSRDSGWKMVHVEGKHVVYLRSNNKYRILAAQNEIRSNNFDINSFVLQQFKKDPSPIRAILPVSEIFLIAGELDLAIEIVEAVLNYQPTNITFWKKLLNLYKTQGLQSQKKGDDHFMENHTKKVLFVLQKIIELDPGDVEAQGQLKLLTAPF